MFITANNIVCVAMTNYKFTSKPGSITKYVDPFFILFAFYSQIYLNLTINKLDNDNKKNI